MASMNNWLAFSLSPQELPSQHEHQDHTQSSVSRLAFNSDEISGTDVSGGCYHLPSDSTTLPPPFGILEAFQRNHHHQSHDWNMTGLGLSSDMLMAAGGSCSGQNLENQEPKLENFLGGHSFSDHDHSKIPGGCNANNSNIAAAYDGDHYNMYSSLQLPSDDQTRSDGGGGGGGGNNNSSIGLSMIKTWLRNQPPPPAEGKADGSGGATNGTLTSTQTLSLSMSTGGAAESSSSDTNKQNKATTGGGAAVDSQAAAAGGAAAAEAVPRKSIDTFGQRTSIYRGVTRHRWTGRYEAHLWDNSCRREGQTRKGRQVYLGGYDKEDKAARAYDLAALKYWGTTTTTNFPITTYEKELEEMKHMTRQEYVASLRRKSSGFSRGASIYRGVTRHHQHGRWQARIGRVAGNKDLYLGTFSTQEEAAEAYDIAAIKFRGLNAVTNFDMSRYDVKSILESSTLPIGGAAKRLKDAEQAELTVVDATSSHRTTVADDDSMTSQLTDGISNYAGGWPTIAFQNPPPPPFSVHYSPYSSGHHRAAAAAPGWCKQEQDSFQDFHHLQLGSTHNFFQQHNNLMIPDSSSMEHSSGSNNSVIYGGGADQYGGNNNGNINYMIPMSTVVATDHHHHNNGFGDGGEVKPLGYDHAAVYGGATDPYQARNLYYLSQQSNGAKAAAYDQGSACNNWVPTAVPTLTPARTNNMAVCHGAQTFTVWNDT